MSQEPCEKCGAELPEGALTCRQCGAVTTAGKEARGLAGSTEEEAWARSVAAARARHAQKPAVDADEVLRQVVAKTGTEDQLQRLTRDAIAHDDHRTEYGDFRATARPLVTIAGLLAVVLTMVGLLFVVAATVQNGTTGLMSGMAVAGAVGCVALALYFLLKFIGDTIPLLADMADNCRRSVLLLREIRDQLQTPGEPPHE